MYFCSCKSFVCLYHHHKGEKQEGLKMTGNYYSNDIFVHSYFGETLSIIRLYSGHTKIMSHIHPSIIAVIKKSSFCSQ